MTDLHIDDFYRDTALTLIRLYQCFPRKTILYVDDICGPDEPDEFGLHSERYLSCFSTMIWLGEEGYLRFDDVIRQEALDQVVLSQPALILLSSRSELSLGEDLMEESIPPSVMENALSNINQLRKAVRSGSSIMIQQCVSHLLTSKNFQA